MFGLFKRKPKPFNINDLSHRHFMVAVLAHNAAMVEDEKGTVASRHLREIAQKHASITDVLDKMLEANEKAKG